MDAVVMRVQIRDKEELVGIVGASTEENTFSVAGASLADIKVVQLTVDRHEVLVVSQQREVNLLRLRRLIAGNEASGQRDQDIGLKRPDRVRLAELVNRSRQVFFDLVGKAAPAGLLGVQRGQSAFEAMTVLSPRPAPEQLNGEATRLPVAALVYPGSR